MNKKEKEIETPLTKGEIKYKVFMSPDKEKVAELREKIRENNGYCLSQKKAPDTRCQCREFLLLDKENEYCKCGVFYKIARTEEEIKKFITAKPQFGKNEKRILKEKDPNEENFMDTNVDKESE
jgi:hypothetical protein